MAGCILSRFSTRRSRRGLSPLEVRQYSGWAQAVNTGLTEHSQKVPHITVWKHNAKFTFQESRRGLFNEDGIHRCPHRVGTSCIYLPRGQWLLPAIPWSELHTTGTYSGYFFRTHVCVVTWHNKMMGILYPNFLMLLPPPRPVMFCSAITGIFAPCGSSMCVFPVMHFSHVLLHHYRHSCPLWAVDGCPPSDAFLPPVGRWGLSSPWGSFPPVGRLVVVIPVRQPCPVRALWWVVLSVRQLCPLRATTLMHITISALPLARPYCIGFSLVLSLARLFHWFKFTALPLARLYRMSISLQRCHCQTFALISVYQPCHLPDFIAPFSVYSRATCQNFTGFSLQSRHSSLWHWFQFTAVPLVRLYFNGSSLQSWRLSDYIFWLQFAVLPLVRLYFIGFSLQSATCQIWVIQVQFTTCMYLHRDL